MSLSDKEIQINKHPLYMREDVKQFIKDLKENRYCSECYVDWKWKENCTCVNKEPSWAIHITANEINELVGEKLK